MTDQADTMLRATAAARLSNAISRLIDVVGALTLILAFAPIMLLVAALVASEKGGPVLFRQARLGKGGKHFMCFKFRTMHVDAAERLQLLLDTDPAARAAWDKDHKLKDDPRVTLVGGFLRRSSLDELPQLFNVLFSEMALVGPRPIVDAEVVRYGPFWPAYCSVKPGITGLWQVSGRNDIAYDERVALDTKYARTRGVLVDLKILFATVPAVLLRRGSY